MYGLRSLVPRFRECLEMILSCGERTLVVSRKAGSLRGLMAPANRCAGVDRDSWRGDLFEPCRDLYGLIHARYIVTGRGLEQMVRSALKTRSPHCTLTDARVVAVGQGGQLVLWQLP